MLWLVYIGLSVESPVMVFIVGNKGSKESGDGIICLTEIKGGLKLIRVVCETWQ